MRWRVGALTKSEVLDIPDMPRRRRLTLLGAMLLLLAAPFETLRAVWVAPGQSLSNLELLIAVAAGLWAVDSCARWYVCLVRPARVPGRLRRFWGEDSLLGPLLLLLAIMWVAAAAAPSQPGEALRFMGRFTAAVLVCRVFSNAVTSHRRLGLLMHCAAASGLAVGLIGVLEFFQDPWTLRFLESFRTGLSYAGNLPRVTSTLHYPTITAMYLEIVFALNLGGLIEAARRRRSALLGALLVAQLVVGTCLLLTWTRTSLISLVMLLAVAGWVVRKRRSELATVGALAVGLLLVTSLLAASQQDFWLRVTTLDQSQWYRAHYEVPGELELTAGELTRIPVRLTNLGLAPWTVEPEVPFRLSYHWLTEDGEKLLEFEGLRTELPHPVIPGATVSVQTRVRVPVRAGRYVLAWDLLQENRFWFSEENSPSALTRVSVSGSAAAEAASPQDLPLPRLRLSRFRIWGIALRMLAEHPLLGVGPDNFRHLYGPYAGLRIWDLTFHTHNLYLEFFVGAGLLGGGLFLWLVWRLLGLTFRLLANPGISLSPALATLAILLHGLFDYFLEFTPTYLMVFGTFGILEATARLAVTGRLASEFGPHPSGAFHDGPREKSG